MADSNMADIAKKEVLMENSPRVELASMQSEIRKSLETPQATDLKNFLPKDFNPDNGLLFGKSAASPVKPTLETRNYNVEDAYAQLPSGDMIAKYDTYKAGRDNAEYAAANQTAWEKWGNGATKALAKTGSAVVGGTAGLVYGVGAALKDGSFSSIYDNSFSNTLADWDEKLQYQLPNYYSKQEKELGLFGQMGTANFWSDKFLGGLSFTAGAIISEGIWAYATGGLSLATEGARLGTRIAKAGRWGVETLGEVNALKGLSKYKSFYTTMLEGSVQAGKLSKTLPNALGKIGELASSTGVLARSAGYEASVEALQFKREAEENFQQNFLAMNGREPNAQELTDFKSHNESAANAVFGFNMAILMPSNLVSMGHILDIKSPIKTGFSSFIDKKVFGYGIGKTVDAAGKATFKKLEANIGQKVARNVYNYALKPSLTEGLFEEGLQGVTTKTANKWIEHTYDPRHSNTNLDTMGAFYESLGEQYGTKEGWVENGLGMIIGIVGGSVNARSENRQKAEELSYQADVATHFQTDNLQSLLMPNRLQTANRMAGFSEDAKIEAQKGNVSKAGLAQKSALLTFINAKMTMGEGISDIVREVKMGLDSTTEDQWKEAGIESHEVDNHKEETLKEFETLAKDWKANKTYWGYMIGKKIAGQEELDTDIAGEVTLNNKTGAIIEALAWQSTIGETANKQMKEAQNVIAQELGAEHANTMTLNSSLRSQSRETKQAINVATKSYNIELARRDALVQRIAKLNAAPKSPETGDKARGARAAAMTQALMESEQKLAELDAELQGHAEKINQTEAYQKELGAIDFSSDVLNTNLISGQDLVKLQGNIEKFQKTIDTLKTTNPQRASYLDELLKEYTDSEEVFLKNQLTQRVIGHPDFKIEQVNSWLQGKLKGSAPMNVNTKDWMTDTLETYKRGKVASMAAQTEASVGEEIEEAEEVREEVVPEDKGEPKPKSREQQINDEIADLETKRAAELSEVVEEVISPTANVVTFDLNKVKKPSGSIGSQGATWEGAKSIMEFLGINIDYQTDSLKEIIDYLKANPDALQKLRDFVATEPIVFRELPDGTYQLEDGHHRATLLYYAGIEEVPAIITNAGEYIAENKVEKVDKAQEEKKKINKKYDSKIETLQNELAGKQPTTLEVYKKRISEALKGNHNYLSYIGDNYDDVANKKPTTAEVEEFKKLREEKKFDDERYKELQQKLSDWKLLDSAVDEQYVSIGDLILGVEQLEQEIEEEETVSEITPEDAPDIADGESVQASENITRYDLLQNTNGAMTVKKGTNGKYTLHHLKLATIVDRLETDDYTLRHNKNKILFGQEKPGTILTIEGVEFKVIGGNAIEVKVADFEKLQSKLNMFPLDTKAAPWSYSDIYTKVGDEFVKMESDFKDDTINSDRIYDLKEGDKLTITINNEDGYNAKLLKEYEKAVEGDAKEEALQNLKDNLKLNATTTTGTIENVSILKAMRDEVDEYQVFPLIRERAFERYMAAKDKTNVKLGIEVLVDGIFLGSPRFIISEEGTTENRPITERAAKEVDATGYILNGELVLSKEIKDVNKTFVGKLSHKNKDKKIPVVVFKRGNYSIAYPVTMSKKSNDLGSLFTSIMDMRISDQEKIRKINTEIQGNKVKTKKLAYEDIYNDKKMQATYEAFQGVKTYMTADDFAKKGNAAKDALININLLDIDSVIQDAKLRIKLDDTVKFSEEREVKLASQSEVEKALNDIAVELNKDLVKNADSKYVDSKGNILEETHYVDTFSNYKRGIVEGDSNLVHQENSNLLREAFKNLDKRIKSIIGDETVSKVKSLFDQLDFIKKQGTPNKNDVNNGSNNSKCGK